MNAHVQGPAVDIVRQLKFVYWTHPRSDSLCVSDEVLPDDDNGHTGGANILLCTCVDDAVLADVNLGTAAGGGIGEPGRLRRFAQLGWDWDVPV